jgi:hypothetical protein
MLVAVLGSGWKGRMGRRRAREVTGGRPWPVVLVAVVDQTMQPTTASLWLRSNQGPTAR